LTTAHADTLPFPTLAAPARFALALGAVMLVFLVDQTFGLLVDDGSEFVLLGTAVMASAWIGGTGPALLAVVAGGVLGARGPAEGLDRASQVHLALFVVHGLLLTGVFAEMRRAHRVAESRAREANLFRRTSEAAARMKDEFLATLSHEMRTPLNAALGWIHLLRRGGLDADTTRRGMESVERNVRRQAQITSDLLDVSRSLSGQLDLDATRVSLADVTREAIEGTALACAAKRVTVDAALDVAPLVVLGDARRLRQIASQLVANAVKFAPRNSTVSIRVDQSNDTARLMVSDTGPGIAAEFLPRIFDRFSQEDASPIRVAGGLGIGLSLVRELVELHGGRIVAGNRADSRGAVFTVSLPLQGAGASTAIPSSGVRTGARLDGVRVLVFDQDREGSDVVRLLLRESGADVQIAESLADALEGLESWRPDVLLSEAPGSGGDAYALVAKLPALESARGGRIPLLALTAFARHDPAMRKMLAGCTRDLPAPLELARLTAEIARLTSGRSGFISH
jgi:signal transduction histidine kinase